MTRTYMVRLRSAFLALVTLVIASSSLMAQWSDLPDLPETRTTTQQAIVAGKLYVFGGFNASGVSQPDAWVLDLSDVAAGWQAIASMPETRVGGYAAAIDGKIYIAGGVGNDAGVVGRTSVLEYDPMANTYTPRGTMTTPAWFMGAATVGSKIYLMGGLTRLGTSNTPIQLTQIYDVTTQSWTAGPQMPSLYYQGNAVGIGNDVYYFGGLNRSGSSLYLNGGVLKLTGGTGNWATVPGAMFEPVYNAAAGILDGKVYVAGGLDVNGEVKTTQVYDPVTNGWSGSYALATATSASGPLSMPAEGESLYLIGAGTGDALKLTIGAPRAVANVAPSAINIATKVGGSGTKVLSISNTGILALTGTIDVAGAPWLTVSSTSINVPAGSDVEFTLTADATGLAAGVYNGTITVNTNDTENSAITVPVRLYVVETLVEQETNVVLEEATGNWCPPCGAYGTPEVKRLMNVYGERLITIAYHDRGGRPTEPMATAQTEAMTAKLGVPYWPAAAVQRIDWPEEEGLMTGTDTWAGHIEQVLSQTPIAPAALEVVEYEYNPGTKRVTAKIKITTADAIDFDGSTLRLTAVVMEDSLLYSQAGSTESPYYHMHAVRSFWPNIDGQQLTLPAGATGENGTVLLPGKEIIVDASWAVTGVVDPANSHVVWLLHLNEGSRPGIILQGQEMSLLGEAASGGIIAVVPDAASKTIAVGQTAVFNTSVTNLTDAAIEVNVDRMSNTLPSGEWSSQLCVNDDCVLPTANKVTTTLTPGETVVFKVKVVGGTASATGSVGIAVSAGDTVVSQTYTVTTGTSGVGYETGSTAAFGVAAYPNPIVGEGRIEFAVPTSGTTTVELFATSGEKVMTLSQGRREAGRHSLDVDLSSLPAGIYSIVLSSGDRKVARTISIVH